MTRSEHITHAVRALIRAEQPVTVENARTRLSAEIGSTLTDDELVRAHASVEGIELSSAQVEEPPTGTYFDPQRGIIRARRAPVEAPAELLRSYGVEELPTAPATQPEAVAAVQAAQRARAECAAVVVKRKQELQAARGVLHSRVQEYMAGGEQHDEGAAYRATSTADRAERVKRFGTGVSRTAAAFVRKRMTNGPQRGALSEAGRARFGFKVPGSPAAQAKGPIGPDKIRGQQ